MLMAILAMIGLAPAQAAHDPCLGPSWAVSERVAVACDFKDANAAATNGIPGGYVGSRSKVAFRLAPLHGVAYKAVLVSDKVVRESDSQTDTALIGSHGGWVDETGTAHGAANSWTLDLTREGIHAKPGSLVALIDGQPT